MGYIIWEGPSRYDGSPIMVAVTGIERKSTNTKTGSMVQVYILRPDMYPAEALNGQDEAICGECPHRRKLDAAGTWGGRSCYVRMDSISSVWKAATGYVEPADSSRPGMKWGPYRRITPTAAGRIIGDRPLRLGAYGDPAMVPQWILRQLLKHHTGTRTGYTHQWRQIWADGLQDMVMASCDTEQDVAYACAAGWRTFRVGGVPMVGEILCPASAEAGRKTTCEACGLCNGSRGEGDRRRNIYIPPHGQGRRFFQAS